MSARVILDTGPLVAYFCTNEVHHRWAVGKFSTFATPALVCEPVLAETCFLLARQGVPERRVLDLVERDVLRIGLRLDRETVTVANLLDRYHNVPMSLADGCLVRMAELFDQHRVCTLDSDFLIYRKHGRQPIELIMPSTH